MKAQNIIYLLEFVKHFPSLDRKVLTLLATFLGNDYVDTDLFKSYYSLIGKLKGKTTFNIPKFDDKTETVILWLQRVKTHDEVMSTIESSDVKKAILSAFEKTTEAFTLNDTEN